MSSRRTGIIDAVPAEDLDTLRNTDTGMINDTIPDIIQYLQSNFGQITDQELSDTEDELKSFIYDLNAPVDFVFDKIKMCQHLCILIENTKFDRQLVQFAYLIVIKTKALWTRLSSRIPNLLLKNMD